jgi:ParB/RepB/Spo0J family partition protein
VESIYEKILSDISTVKAIRVDVANSMWPLALHASASTESRIVDLNISRLLLPGRKLRDIDQTIVKELARSIESNGLLQPILVRPTRQLFEIVFGLHRVEACRLLRWTTISSSIREMSESDAFIVRIVENLHRNLKLDAIEEARGYIDLIDDGWTISSIARKIGKSDSYVSDRVGLVRRLHPTIAWKIARGETRTLNASHAELIARLPMGRRQLEAATLVERKRLSVRGLERLIQAKQPIRVRLVQHGPTVQVALPLELARACGLGPDSEAQVYGQRNRIVIEPVLAERM